MIHVFLGTHAEYIKTAPLLRLLADRGIPHRLIDAGQHAAFGPGLRAELGVREPDHVLGDDHDVETIPQALRWSVGVALRLPRRRRLREEVFGGRGGICVVHGDTPSTLLATLLARRAGLRVAHLEAGLRSRRLLHPFPEELVRRVVMRLAHVLFAPDATAVANLTAMRVKGEIVPLSANTVAEALTQDLPASPPEPGSGPAVVTMHRVENLNRRARLEGFVDLVARIARTHRVRFLVHGPTRAALRGTPHLDRLVADGVVVSPLVPHTEFVAMLSAAPLVVTDGGSIQEECARLGVPTLLWRASTERPDGLGANILISDYSPATVDRFLARTDELRRVPATDLPEPSQQVLDRLTELDSTETTR